MSGKVNPRRRPATQADIERAAKATRDTAIRLTSTIFLSVLCDKEGADAETIRRVWNEVTALSDSISQGYVNISDLRDTLRKEYGVDINF